MITFDPSLLLSALTVRTPFAAGAGVESANQRKLTLAKAAADKVAPWATANRPAETEAAKRVRELLAGAALTPESVRRAKPGDAADETQLFNAFRTLDGLRLLAERAAQTKGVTPADRTALQERFARGVREAADLLATLDTERVVVAPGAKAEEVESAFALRRGKREYVTRAIHEGSLTTPVAAWTGDLRFQIVIRPGQPAERRLVINLAEMVAAPPTLDAMIGFINAKLEAEGLSTRFAKQELPKLDGAKPDAPQRWALKIQGFESEPMAFEAEAGAAQPAVFALTSRGGPDAARGELAKLTETDPALQPTSVFAERLAADPLRADRGDNPFQTRAAARGPDGSMYVVGEARGPVGGSMGVAGASDVFLSKYDSAGRRLWTRPLGASEAGQGFSVAVGANGTVAVAGAVRGRAEKDSVGGLDAFVAAYGADGAELWVRQRGSRADDEARAVAVGADGTVFVGGRTRGSFTAEANAGGWDAYVSSYGADGTAGFTRRIATTGEERIDALAIAGDGQLLAGGVESGAGVLRKLDASGADVWTRTTAALGDGAVRQIAVDGNDIALVGSTTAQDLGLGGGLAQASGGRRDGFVMKLTDGASPTADWTRFIGGADVDAAESVTIAQGAVYVAATVREANVSGVMENRAVIEKLDLADGARAWRTQASRQTGDNAAVAVMVDPAAGGPLDRFGLPTGLARMEDAAPLVARTGLEAGDHFFVRINGATARKITIQADDTLSSLAKRMNGVLRTRGSAETRLSNDADRLVLKPADGQRIELVRGARGQDALSVLGLSPGTVRDLPGEPGAARSDAPPVVALNFREALGFSDPTSAQLAMREIEQVQRSLRRAYNAIFTDPAAERRAQAASGPVPEAFRAQLANYQAGLERLQSGAPSGGGALFGLF